MCVFLSHSLEDCTYWGRPIRRLQIWPSFALPVQLLAETLLPVPMSKVFSHVRNVVHMNSECRLKRACVMRLCEALVSQTHWTSSAQMILIQAGDLHSSYNTRCVH